MYSEVFCKVYNEFGWNYYPEVFGQQLLEWLKRKKVAPASALDLGCGTGILCEILHKNGMRVSGMDLSPAMIEIAKKECPEIDYQVADMITFRPAVGYDLVTCTGDALNHIENPEDIEKIFRNVSAFTKPGGYFIFDILNEKEVSTSEPFEMDMSETQHIWFQMTQPAERKVHLTVRVYEKDQLSFEEVIRETVHDPEEICRMLRECGFRVVQCEDRLLEDSGHGTTWFIVAQKAG